MKTQGKTYRRSIPWLVMLLIAMTLIGLTGCAKDGEYASLEAYLEKNPMDQDYVNSVAEAGQMDVTVTGNDMLFELHFHGTIEAGKEAAWEKKFDEGMDELAPTVVSMINDLSEKSGLEGVVVTFKYYDGNGKEIYERIVKGAK